MKVLEKSEEVSLHNNILGIKPLSPVKFVPANIFGIANSGISSSAKNRLDKGRNGLFSPQRKSATNFFNKKQYDEPVNIVDEMLSTMSSGITYLNYLS